MKRAGEKQKGGRRKSKKEGVRSERKRGKVIDRVYLRRPLGALARAVFPLSPSSRCSPILPLRKSMKLTWASIPQGQFLHFFPLPIFVLFSFLLPRSSVLFPFFIDLRFCVSLPRFLCDISPLGLFYVRTPFGANSLFFMLLIFLHLGTFACFPEPPLDGAMFDGESPNKRSKMECGCIVQYPTRVAQKENDRVFFICGDEP